MTYWFIIIGCIILLFGAVVFIGAPYVPTRRRDVRLAFDLLELKEGDLLIDLGSGDGAVLKAAAQHGYRALGYEINPVLCLVAKLRCLPFGRQVSVRWRDFWITQWPPEASAVFIFLAGPHMNRLHKRLQTEMTRRKTPLKVVSYGFTIPGYLPKRIKGGLFLYELHPK